MDTETTTPVAEQPSARTMRIVRHAREAPLGALAGGNIDGIDAYDAVPEDEQEASPWWAITSFEDLDRAQADIVACELHCAVLQDQLARRRATLQARSRALLTKYGQYVPAPEEGKQYKQTRGEQSGGSYRNMPGRLPEIKLTDKVAALKAGYAKEIVSIAANTEAVRTADPGDLIGVELIPQPAVSYTPPKAGQ